VTFSHLRVENVFAVENASLTDIMHHKHDVSE
jgi:hypothetical protein